MNKRAFTLLELLVVLGILALLGSTLVPGLARARSGDKAFVCLNHHRMLVNGWRMYSADYGDRVANNYWIPSTENTINDGTLANWVNNVMTWDASANVDARSVTNTIWLRKGVMASYTPDISVYRCPSDNYLSPQQSASGWTARLRSVSMNALFGRSSTTTDGSEQGRNAASPQNVQYLKVSQVPKPAKTWLFLDEHPDSVNDGYFLNSTQNTSWGDIPAAYHNGGCSFSFVDGHVELRSWQSAVSRIPLRYTYTTTPVFDAAGQADFAWYLARSGFIDYNSGALQFGY